MKFHGIIILQQLTTNGTMTQIIAIAGKKGHGKSTIAQMIVESLPGYTEIRSFAGPVKRNIMSIFPYVTLEMLTDSKLKNEEIIPLGITPRELMTRFAGDFCRRLDENLWVTHADNEVSRLMGLHIPPNTIIFDDLRHENEYEYLREMNTIFVYVDRPEPTKSWWERFTSQKPHESEVGLLHHFDKNKDFYIDTSREIGYTREEINKISMIRFNKYYEN